VTVTRADVAAAAGVSSAVVSYVVNDGPRPVSPETRARVLTAIDELGYRPNRIASALRRGRSRMVGLVTESPTNPYVAELAESFGASFMERDLTLVMGFSNNSPDREAAFIRSLVDHRVDGIITATGNLRPEILESLDGVPLVAVDRVPAHEHRLAGSVALDNAHAAHLAVDHLLEHGHTIVACVGGPWQAPLTEERVAGWASAIAQSGAAVDQSLIERAEFSVQGGYAAAMALLGPMPRRHGNSAPPTALFVSSDVQAIGVLQACSELGIRVPGDLAIVSIDGTDMALRTSPTLTSVRQPLAEITDLAVDILNDAVVHAGHASRHEVLRGNLVIGRSCGCGLSG